VHLGHGQDRQARIEPAGHRVLEVVTRMLGHGLAPVIRCGSCCR
jgi:hypothetical protein